MKMEKFVFYDYETTGISPEYDQPLQFAAIITDLDFNEIESGKRVRPLGPTLDAASGCSLARALAHSLA